MQVRAIGVEAVRGQSGAERLPAILRPPSTSPSLRAEGELPVGRRYFPMIIPLRFLNTPMLP